MKLSMEFSSESETRMRRLMRRFEVSSEVEIISWALGLLDVASEYAHDERTITVVEPESLKDIDPEKTVDLKFGRASRSAEPAAG